MLICSIVFFVGGLGIAFEICDNNISCSKNTWKEVFWGNLKHKISYCETRRKNRLMSQHANSMSNLGYCVVGTIVIGCGIGDFYRLKRVIIGTEKKKNDCEESDD